MTTISQFLEAEKKKFDKHFDGGGEALEYHDQLFLAQVREIVESELDIQKKVQEKSKEVVAIGRARVAGMVAEKYTRIGKIEALQDILSLLTDTK